MTETEPVKKGRPIIGFLGLAVIVGIMVASCHDSDDSPGTPRTPPTGGIATAHVTDAAGSTDCAAKDGIVLCSDSDGNVITCTEIGATGTYQCYVDGRSFVFTP